jgi:chromosome segregation ATPase
MSCGRRRGRIRRRARCLQALPAGDAHRHRSREDLESTIEELEGSNEELKASNEEVMSMNEELQSANEELETSKEELQSLNEELTTVNNQLQDKVDELERTTNDITNLLSSTETPRCASSASRPRPRGCSIYAPPTWTGRSVTSRRISPTTHS